jgi:thiamine-monophosphate kinase
MSWSEARLHAWIGRAARPRGLYGAAMHDAAVLQRSVRHPVLCVDQVVEGVHFERATAAEAIGRKAVDRVLSDLAATAADPRAVLLSICAPRRASESRLRRIIGAVRTRAAQFGAQLVGGDLCCGPGPLQLSLSALGEWPFRVRPPARARARVGDLVFLTGPVGGSRLGRHLSIEPRLSEGRWLARHGAHALMDVSDGLALDLSRLADTAGVRIDVSAVPVHADARRRASSTGRSARWHALSDGEDHELIACVPRARVPALLRASTRVLPELCYVGRVRRGRGLWLCDVAAAKPRRWSPSSGQGWIHGR